MRNKYTPRHITVAEMAPHVHSFAPNENKVNKISKWLIDWIKNALARKQICPCDFLPSKGDLAFHIGVSQGTIQNVFRCLEDLGYVESKQRVGTYIKNPENKDTLEKLTSRREIAVEKIKEYIIKNNFKAGDCLISSRKLAQILDVSNATVRTAISSLISEKVIEKKQNHYVLINTNFKVRKVENKTLVEKIAEDIEHHIQGNCKHGEKIPTNTEYSKMFNVSVKTVHDAIKLLAREGVVLSRRGRYGTTVLLNKKSEDSLYYYEQIELKIRYYITQNCEVGSKLPSIQEFATMYSVSPKTIKKALDNLAEDGYLTFTRGRWGGTFVMDIPQGGSEAYQWLALSADYFLEGQN